MSDLLHRNDHKQIDSNCELCTKHYFGGGGDSLNPCSRCDVWHENRKDMCSHCEEDVYEVQQNFAVNIKPFEQRRLDRIQTVLDSLGIRMNSYYANTVQFEGKVSRGELTQEQVDKFWKEVEPINDMYFQEAKHILDKYQDDLKNYMIDL